ncbi:riboflavin biosynthesis protein [Clostridia bacterium]|nr:riboflavin biosynthesis protein [Clostridia bacterium]
MKYKKIALGKLETLHIGHRKLISELQNADDGLETALFSFAPSPVEFFSGDSSFKYIFTNDERRYIAETLGVTRFIQYPFDKGFSETPPEEFIKFLCENFNVRKIAAGETFRFGHKKEGTSELILKLSEKYGYTPVIVPNVRVGGEIVSSSRIRGCILDTKLREAQTLLGRHYFLRGEVCRGKELARTLGFPTANILIPKKKLLPQDGVYKSIVCIDKERYTAVSNVGTNPTFGETQKKCETHIPRYDGNLYGKIIVVNLTDFIRPERKFENIEELKKQVTQDINSVI